jgi:hypothetical protein
VSARTAVVVRCLTCGAAVDRAAAASCPFCGTDLGSMPLIEPERPPAPRDERAPPAPVTALAVVRGRRPRRRPGPVLACVVVAAALGAVAGGGAPRRAAAALTPALPSVAIPVVSRPPPAPRPAPSPVPTPAAAPAGEQTAAGPPACDFFTTQEIQREYDFQQSRADITLARALENNDHVFAIDHDAKAHDARAKAANAAHASAIARLNAAVGRARAACDPSYLS